MKTKNRQYAQYVGECDELVVMDCFEWTLTSQISVLTSFKMNDLRGFSD